MTWNKGDKCLFQFEPAIVTEVKNGKAIEVEIKSGLFVRRDNNINELIIPHNELGLKLSATFIEAKQNILDSATIGANMGAILKKLTEIWIDCYSKSTDSFIELGCLNYFRSRIVSEMDRARNAEIYGVKIFI